MQRGQVGVQLSLAGVWQVKQLLHAPEDACCAGQAGSRDVEEARVQARAAYRCCDSGHSLCVTSSFIERADVYDGHLLCCCKWHHHAVVARGDSC
jgi:hypothetical protein